MYHVCRITIKKYYWLLQNELSNNCISQWQNICFEPLKSVSGRIHTLDISSITDQLKDACVCTKLVLININNI